MQNFNKFALRLPGAARGPRAGEGVLAIANFSLHLLILPVREKGKFVSARRRKQHAWRRGAPQKSQRELVEVLHPFGLTDPDVTRF